MLVTRRLAVRPRRDCTFEGDHSCRYYNLLIFLCLRWSCRLFVALKSISSEQRLQPHLGRCVGDPVLRPCS
jgi:hypothetical protein